MANLTNLNNKFLVTTGGNVGIGTTAPAQKLQVHGGNINIQNADGAYLTFNNGDASIVANYNGSGRDLSFKTYSGSSNAERMRINKDGNVGIGTASPTQLLTVWGGNVYLRGGDSKVIINNIAGASNNEDIVFQRNDSTQFILGLNSSDSFTLFGSSTSTSHLTITNTGNVGIGTTSPTSPTSVARFLEIEGATAGIVLHDSDVEAWDLYASGGKLGTRYNNGVNGWWLDSSGNMGIGTTSPSVLLDARLSGTTGKIAEFHNNAGYGIGFTVESDGGVNTINSESNQALAFATNGASNERMRITSGGDTQLSGNNLDIKGASAGNTQIRITDSTGTTGTNSFDLINDGTAAYVWNRKQTDLNFATYGSLRMKIRASGTVGIGANGGYDSQMLSIDAGVLDGAIYATSSDANCFASFRDGNSNVNVEYGAVGNDHVLRKDAAQYFVVNNVGDVYNYQSVNKANTYYGYDAGNYDGTGSSNTAMGYEAGGALTTGTQNVCIGRNAGDKLTTGINNTSIGTNSGFSNVDGAQNTYIGAAAGYTSPGQNYNTFVGREAGYFNVANENTAVGRNAMHANTSGLRNVSLGFNSLSSNQTGNGNTALGYKALTSSTSNYNVGIGDRALAQLTTGASNIAIGTESGFLETTGSSQIFIGFRAGYNINNATTASGENVIIGHQAAINRTGGTENVFIGSLANYIGVGTGSNNVVVGRYAGAKMTSATRCTFLGHQAGAEVTTGPNNTFIGKGAGDSTTTGSNNTHVGQAAGDEASTGDYNICIGHGSGSGSSPFQLTTQSGRVVIGDNSITNAYTRVSWTVTSDKRDKTDFGDVPHGLDFVSKLKPISYKFRKDRDSEETQGSKRYGFLAQEVLQLEGENPVIIDNTDEDKLSYTESNLVPVLVKAIQELKAEIELLKSK